MDELFKNLLFQVASVVLSLAFMALVVWVKSYINKKIGSEKMKWVLERAEVLVKWAEQTMKDVPGFQKKEAVMIALKALLEAIDFFLSDAELDQIVEAKVFELKGQ